MEISNPDTMTTMRAAQIDSYGNGSNVVVRDIAIPTPGDEQVLVKVSAASLNPFDLTVMRGDARSTGELIFPATMGQDFTGTIVKIGNDVNDFSVGDNVYGTANALFGGSGACAEFVVAHAKNVAVAPMSIDSTIAASLPTAGATALQAIKNLQIKAGDKLFIHGGAGGVGSFAIQIAKSMGAHVTVTASLGNSDYVKSLGADEVIDYKNQNYNEIVRDYDAALNAVRTSPNDLLAVLKEGGRAVSLTEPFDEAQAQSRGITVILQSTKITNQLLEELAQLAEGGDIKSVVERTFSLSDIRDAYTTFMQKSVRGKIVIVLARTQS